MNRLLLFAFALLFCGSVKAQQTITDSILHDGMYRQYILYVPAIYTPGTAVPLIFNFHGYTSFADQQMFYANFRPIADTANFLLVHPQGTLDQSNQPYWNSGWGGTVDDVSFTEALIDSLSAQYSVNQDRVYSTGMSNGGFMSYTLACELSYRIAAIASVTGSMNAFQSLSCNPQHPMPVMQIHGTADAAVPYLGSATIASNQDVLDYWVNTNVCDLTPIQTEVPDINLTDGCTATHFRYTNGNNGVEVEHYRINGGAHTWPSAPIVIGITSYDVHACKEIWRFFSQYDINGRILGLQEADPTQFAVYPNPAHDLLTLENSSGQVIRSISVVDLNGQALLKPAADVQSIDVSTLAPGVYFLKIETDKKSFIHKFIRE